MSAREWMHRVFRREVMDGDGVCPVYLTRWTLLRVGHLAAYLHRFSGSDWALDFHDHPKRFVSIGLRGCYIEHTPNGAREWRAPWIRSFPANHCHRIDLPPETTCWTLVIVGRAVRSWGFWLDGAWIPWRQYVRKHGRDRRAC